MGTCRPSLRPAAASKRAGFRVGGGRLTHPFASAPPLFLSVLLIVAFLFLGDDPSVASTTKMTSTMTTMTRRSFVSLSRVSALATPTPTRRTVTSTTTTTTRNKLRWMVRGIGPELFQNAVIRHASAVFGRTTKRSSRGGVDRCKIRNQGGENSGGLQQVAVITGATGGIGAEAAHILALEYGYDVLLLARDAGRGEALASDIRRRIVEKEVEDGCRPEVAFVEYHADVPESARDAALATERFLAADDDGGVDNGDNDDGGSAKREVEGRRRRRLSVVINNAGVMGTSISKETTMQVNVLGPALLTLALLPAMLASEDVDTSDDDGRCSSNSNDLPPPIVINVASSSHLRASSTMTTEDATDESPDADLYAYARSKLALMQFSTLLRNSGERLRVIDAHPGLVWTPLLRNHFSGGGFASALLAKAGLARWIYKSPSEGAWAILGALARDDDGNEEGGDITTTSEEEGKMRWWRRSQAYYVNGKPGGYAAPESRDDDVSAELWRSILEPAAKTVAPEGCRLVSDGLEHLFRSQEME